MRFRQCPNVPGSVTWAGWADPRSRSIPLQDCYLPVTFEHIDLLVAVWSNILPSEAQEAAPTAEYRRVRHLCTVPHPQWHRDARHGERQDRPDHDTESMECRLRSGLHGLRPLPAALLPRRAVPDVLLRLHTSDPHGRPVLPGSL